ncbi:hypothetical protein K491DRAFT_464235 [Lophiostoma macrostomum CBS 122681]|uniref:Uncharacterized protein n=1 Tax=Lophiostoma macrostomum CBS 122681 TaxID=1314788 RepID=A0A6A6T3M5_9PLEO|nr:hypothetical protein K491DRAFT_464235 [Lophiostoma macrostomum CBS 122681]
MNWTGGSLQRHSKNAHKGIVRRQKQHFAKVRTALQNRPLTSATPFRPSFLEDEHLTVSGQMPSFGLGSVRHTGHAKRYERCASPVSRQRHAPLGGRASYSIDAVEHMQNTRAAAHAASSASASSVGTAGSTLCKLRRVAQKKGASDVDVEDQLLEANRQRLLQKQDWAGLVPTRPVSMHFASRKEKEGIGKRRRVHGHSAMQHHQACDNTERSSIGEEYPGRALRTEAKDIRVRIGTDALASQTPMQRSDYARSQAAGSSPGQVSDPMLFDLTEAPRTTVSVRASGSRSPSIVNYAVVGSTQPAPHPSHRVKRLNVSPACDADQRTLHQQHAVSEDDHDLRNLPREPASTNALQPKEHIGFVFPMTQSGVECEQAPFCFTFEKSSNYAGAVGDTCVASQDNLPDNATFQGGKATFSDLGQALSENGIFRGESSGDNTSTPLPAITDDGSWKVFVEMPDHSASYSGSSYPGGRPLSPTPAVQPTIPTQHATVGDHTRISSSSCVSASLSSIKDADSRAMLSLSRPAAAAIPSRQSQDIDESERLWKTFVFESGEDHATESVYDNNIQKEKTAAVSVRNGSSVLPLSDAVGATVSLQVVPTSCRSASPLGLRLSDNVQHAAYHAPPSMSPEAGPHYSTFSPISRAYAQMTPGRIGPVTDTHMNGVLRATESNRFRKGLYATQSSLLNNVSDDTNRSSSMLPQGGLDHRRKAKNSCFRPNWGKERESSRYVECSTIYDLPVSDAEG